MWTLKTNIIKIWSLISDENSQNFNFFGDSHIFIGTDYSDESTTLALYFVVYGYGRELMTIQGLLLLLLSVDTKRLRLVSLS